MGDERLTYFGPLAAERVDYSGGKTSFVECLHGLERLWWTPRLTR